MYTPEFGIPLHHYQSFWPLYICEYCFAFGFQTCFLCSLWSNPSEP